MAWPAKDPSEILDYSWTVPLDIGDTIAAHSAVVVSGTVVIASSTVTGAIVTAFITGGVAGETAILRFDATTTGGRKHEDTLLLPIIDSANAFELAFKAAFPAFEETSSSAIAFWYARAGRIVTSAYGDDEEYAAMLLTAHYLTLQGFGAGAEAQRASKFGGATNIKSGSLSLSWEGAGASSEGIRSTSYGKLFFPFLRVHGGSPGITNTGTVPYDARRFPHGEA